MPRTVANDLLTELVALRRIFAHVRCLRRAGVLCVQTREIVAYGLALGRFEIRLDLNRIGSQDAYRVIALEPRPTRANRLVTHPHVFSERLCEGSAAPLIQKALLAGRLSEFFALVARLLASYSPGRCYVEPADWHLPACIDCADIVRLAPAHCRSCDEVLCPRCGTNCPWCEGLMCCQCASDCAVCRERFCWNCLEFCLFCEQPNCPNCRIGRTCLICNQGD